MVAVDDTGKMFGNSESIASLTTETQNLTGQWARQLTSCRFAHAGQCLAFELIDITEHFGHGGVLASGNGLADFDLFVERLVALEMQLPCATGFASADVQGDSGVPIPRASKRLVLVSTMRVSPQYEN
jgi:hypothetical protein